MINVPPNTTAMTGVNDLPTPSWATWFTQIYDNLKGVIQLNPFVVAKLPSPNKAGGLIFVPDEIGGATVAYSDGTNWRRMDDNSIVS